MKSIQRLLVLPLLAGCVYMVGCDGNSAGSFQALLSQFSGSSLNGRDSLDDTSVSDVSSGLNNPSTDSIYAEGASRARVRNESGNPADITLYFYADDLVVHSAFIHILPDMITTVASLKKVDSVELTGEDVSGRILNGRTYYFGTDFNAFIPAEYVIRPDGQVELLPTPPGPTNGPVQPTLKLLEPAADVWLPPGSVVNVRWVDEGWNANALIQVFLQPVDLSSSAPRLIPMGAPIEIALDGLNDERLIVLEKLMLGDYRVMVQSHQAGNTITAIAPGIIHLIADPTNAAPELEILSPNSRVALYVGDTLDVTWNDRDIDHNATITFELESVAQSGMATGKFAISGPIAEDPDGDFDSARFILHQVLPGLYDLVGTIDDGKSTGTSRVPGVVQVLPGSANDVPTLEFTQPMNNIHVPFDESFLVRWVDSDENDNARISFLLDPDLGNTPRDGNEILLIHSIDEDGDGQNDQRTLELPEGIKEKPYRLLGVIMDGQTEVVITAPGRVVVIGHVDDNQGGHDDGTGGEETIPDLPIVDVGDLDSVNRITLKSTEYLIQATSLPRETPGRVIISNVLSGGSLEIELLTEQWNVSLENGLTLTIPDDLVSSDVTPRLFDVIFEYLSDGGRRTIVSDSPITIQ